jgi:hypothetical protein
VQASSAVQGIPSGRLAEHVPASQKEDWQSPSPVHALPFGCVPQVPSTHSAEAHAAALEQGCPSGSPHLPWKQAPPLQSSSRAQGVPFPNGPQEPLVTPLAMSQSFDWHSSSRVQSESRARGPQCWSAMSQMPEVQSLSRLHASPVATGPQVPTPSASGHVPGPPQTQMPDVHSASLVHIPPPGWGPHLPAAESQVPEAQS